MNELALASHADEEVVQLVIHRLRVDLLEYRETGLGKLVLVGQELLGLRELNRLRDHQENLVQTVFIGLVELVQILPQKLREDSSSSHQVQQIHHFVPALGLLLGDANLDAGVQKMNNQSLEVLQSFLGKLGEQQMGQVQLLPEKNVIVLLGQEVLQNYFEGLLQLLWLQVQVPEFDDLFEQRKVLTHRKDAEFV